MSDEIIITPPAPIDIVITPTVGAPGSIGATGPSGVITAASPLIYNSGAQSISLDQTKLSINATQVVGTAAILGANIFTGTQTLKLSSTTSASLNLANGTAPTSPVTGDLWALSGSLQYQSSFGAQTLAYLSSNITGNAASITGTIAASQVSGTAAVLNSANTFTANQTFPGITSSTITATQVTITGTPSNATDAVTKSYADNISAGLNAHDSVLAGTTGNLSATYTAGTTGADGGTGVGAFLQATANGALVVDGVTTASSPAIATDERILVKDQTSASQNGIYTVTVVGSSTAPWKMTRATDYDNSIAGEVFPGDITFVISGATQANLGYVMNSRGTATTPANGIKIGTDTISWTQFSGAAQVVAGAGLTKSANTLDAVGTTNRILVNADNIDISPNYVGQSSITTLGTITTGVWNGTNINATQVTGTVAAATTAVNLTGTILATQVTGTALTQTTTFAGDVTGTSGTTLIATSAVTTVKLADGSVTAAKTSSASPSSNPSASSGTGASATYWVDTGGVITNGATYVATSNVNGTTNQNTVTVPSSSNNIFRGMSVVGPAGFLGSGVTVSSVNYVTNTVTLSSNNLTTTTGVTCTFSSNLYYKSATSSLVLTPTAGSYSTGKIFNSYTANLNLTHNINRYVLNAQLIDTFSKKPFSSQGIQVNPDGSDPSNKATIVWNGMLLGPTYGVITATAGIPYYRVDMNAVPIMAISGNGTTVTATASHNFSVGDKFKITGTGAYDGNGPSDTGFIITAVTKTSFSYASTASTAVTISGGVISTASYTSSTVASFTYGGTSLVATGQTVAIAGVTGGNYNGTWVVSTVTSPTAFIVNGTGFTSVTGTSGAFQPTGLATLNNGQNYIAPASGLIVYLDINSGSLNIATTVGQSSSVLATLTAEHGLAIGDTVTVAGVTPSTHNTTNAPIISVPSPTQVVYSRTSAGAATSTVNGSMAITSAYRTAFNPLYGALYDRNDFQYYLTQSASPGAVTNMPVKIYSTIPYGSSLNSLRAIVVG